MEHIRLFPTSVFIKRNAFKDANYLKQIVLREKTNNPTWQSKADLHTRPEYKDFVHTVIENTKSVLQTMQFDYEGFRINDMWSNILEPGQSHSVHTHANNLLSGVYYPFAEKTSGLVFLDPKKVSSVIKPMRLNNTVDNSDRHLELSETNKMLIFPSWLEHFVPPNDSNNIRISIAWNIQIFGKVGSSKDYQSAEF